MLIAILVVVLSCYFNSKTHTVKSSLTESDSIQIINKVIEATDLFANANNKLDTKGVLSNY